METRHAAEMSCAPAGARTYGHDPDVNSALDSPPPPRRHGEKPRLLATRREPATVGAAAPAQAQGVVAPALGIVTRLEKHLGPERFARSFDGRVNLRVRDGAVEIGAPSKAVSGLLERRFAETIRQAAAEEFGRDVPAEEVRFVVDGAEETSGARARAESNGTHAPERPRAERATRTAERAQSALNERYRLESFVVGESNRLVYNAALQMAEGVDATYRHLFIHGPCGMGKTHLLQGIALRFRERHPGAVVRATSGEQFMTEFVAAIRNAGAPGTNGSANGNSGVERFRRQYRRVDLLCIDDVHFLASKQATQAELLHTFDQIERCGARVVLVSDEHPRSLARFSPALVSRFMAGLVTGLGPPDADLRARIARVFAQGRGLSLDDGAVSLMVERTATLPGSPAISVREIEGLITRIDALHRLRPDLGVTPEGRLGASLVERALGGRGDAGESEPPVQPARPVRIDDIMKQTCTALTVDPHDLSSKTRHPRVVLARAIITHLARALTTLSFPEIARAIGRPNHSTVITAYQRLARQLAADPPQQVELPGATEPRTLGVLVRQLLQAVQAGAAKV